MGRKLSMYPYIYRVERALPSISPGAPVCFTQNLNEIFKVSNIEIAEISHLLIGAVQCCIELDSRSISNTLRLVINSAA